MKKVLCFALCLVLIFLFTGCLQPSNISNSTTEQTETELIKKNFITPHEYSKDEQDLIQLINKEDFISIFDFLVSNDIKSVRVGWDEYENGKLMNLGMENEINISDEGKIAIKISQYDIYVTVQNRPFGDTYSIDKVTTRAYVVLPEKIEITTGSEIPLMMLVLNYDEHVVGYLKNPSYYTENPKKLSKFDKVYLFNCSFSEEVVD